MKGFTKEQVKELWDFNDGEYPSDGTHCEICGNPQNSGIYCHRCAGMHSHFDWGIVKFRRFHEKRKAKYPEKIKEKNVIIKYLNKNFSSNLKGGWKINEHDIYYNIKEHTILQYLEGNLIQIIPNISLKRDILSLIDRLKFLNIPQSPIQNINTITKNKFIRNIRKKFRFDLILKQCKNKPDREFIDMCYPRYLMQKLTDKEIKRIEKIMEENSRAHSKY